MSIFVDNHYKIESGCCCSPFFSPPPPGDRIGIVVELSPPRSCCQKEAHFRMAGYLPSRLQAMMCMCTSTRLNGNFTLTITLLYSRYRRIQKGDSYREREREQGSYKGRGANRKFTLNLCLPFSPLSLSLSLSLSPFGMRLHSTVMPVSHYRGSPEDPLRITLELDHKLGGSSGDPLYTSVTPAISLSHRNNQLDVKH